MGRKKILTGDPIRKRRIAMCWSHGPDLDKCRKFCRLEMRVLVKFWQ